MDIKHPAYELGRGVPSRATIGDTDHDIDEEGYFSIADEADAVRAMDQLASTYGVAYTDDGEIEGERAPETPGSSGEDTAPTDSGADDGGEASDDTAADDGEALAEVAADADELQAMDMDELRDRADAVGVDRDAVDMRQKDEVVAAILRAQTESVDGEGE